MFHAAILTAKSTKQGIRSILCTLGIVIIRDKGVWVTERILSRAVMARLSSPVGMIYVEHVLVILRVASSIDADQEVEGTLVVIIVVVVVAIESVVVLIQS